MKKNIKEFFKEKNIKKIFILLCVLLAFFISIIQPIEAGPDERMKMDVCRYIFENGKLPHGGDEKIRDEIWGISYGFTPILPYILAGIFMKIVSLFSQNFHTFYVAARFVSVLCYLGFLIFTIKIAEKLFKNKFFKWLFICLNSLLPQMIYLASYINNDTFALMCIAIIIYSWLIGFETKWNAKSCIMLAIGLGLCALSYYNAYGFILTSAIVYIVSEIYNKTKFKDIIKKGLGISAIAFVICGWWFIRSAIIYDGDFLGLKTTNIYAEKYAIEDKKPSNLCVCKNYKMSKRYVLIRMRWIELTLKSFIGTFGFMDIFTYDIAYYLSYFIAGIGMIGYFVRFFYKEYRKNIKKDKTKTLLEVIFIINIIIPIILSFYNSYYSDFQPQGRYIMPGLIPIMYFISIGIESLLKMKYINNKPKAQMIIKIIISVILIVIFILCMKTLISTYI